MHKTNERIIYRTPIMKGHNRETIIPLLTGCTIGLFFLLLCLPLHHWKFILLSTSIPLILIISLLLSRSFYIQMDEEQLVIRSAVSPFWTNSYHFTKIQKIELGLKGPGFGQILFLHITTAERRSRRKIINLLNIEDMFALIRELQRRGITVDTTQLQPYLNLLEQCKREKAQGEALRRKAKEYEEQMRREREKMKR